MFVLRDLRLEQGLSRKELSEKSGVPEPTIVALELGRNNCYQAKLETLIKLAKALGCQVRNFYPNEENI